MSVDPFTDALNRFVNQFSEKVSILVDEEDDDGIRVLADGLHKAIGETIGTLLELELECERILDRG